MTNDELRRFEHGGITFTVLRFHNRMTGPHLAVHDDAKGLGVMTRAIAPNAEPFWVSGYGSDDPALRQAIADQAEAAAAKLLRDR